MAGRRRGDAVKWLTRQQDVMELRADIAAAHVRLDNHAREIADLQGGGTVVELLERCRHIEQRLASIRRAGRYASNSGAISSWVEGQLLHLEAVARGEVRPDKYKTGGPP